MSRFDDLLPSCDCEWAPDAGAYVLDALEDHEVPAFQRHLDGCEACREQVAFLQVAADILPLAAPPAPPPPELKGRIMTVVEREAALLRAAGPEADRVAAAPPARKRRWFSGLVLRPPVAAGLACALLALGVGGGLLVQGSGEEPKPVTAQVFPGQVTPEGATAELVVQGQKGMLRLTSMPDAPEGKVYQVWLRAPGSKTPRRSHTLFKVPPDGRTNVAIDEPLTGVAEVLVTAERSGRSLTPTSTPVITARAA